MYNVLSIQNCKNSENNFWINLMLINNFIELKFYSIVEKIELYFFL